MKYLLSCMNSISHAHAILEKGYKYELKFKINSCSSEISIKNNLLNKNINTKDPQAKETFHKKYKD